MYPTKPLGEICDLYQPKTISTKEMIEDGKYPVFGANGIIGKYDKYNHKDKEILITCRGATCGTINISEEFSWINGNAMVAHIKNPKEVNFYFLFYFLKNLDFSKIISGSAQPQITRGGLVNVLVSLPLEESTQQKIVSKLDNLFENIDKNISLTKQNIANIDEENKSILEKIFKECEEEFGSEKFSESCEKITDGSHNPPKGVEKGFPMISSRNIENNKIFFDNIRYLSEEDYILENKRTNAMEGDILLSIVGTIGKVAIVKKEYGKFVMQRSLALLRFKNKKFLSEFVYYFLINPNTQKKLSNGAKGATQKGIYLKDLKNFQIPLPPLQKQQEIVEKLDKIFSANSELKNFYEKNLKNLEELKQSILKQAFEDENFIK